MRRLSVTDPERDHAAIAEAATQLRAGGLVAFPTETVYGLGANALDEAAVARIFSAKGRPATNPLIVHVPDAEAARALATEWPDTALKLAKRFWPGPLTIILPKRPDIPEITTAGLDTVALRVPAHPVAQAILRATHLPIAAPSANRSMSLSPTRADHVERSLGPRVDLIIDGGATEVGIESTVLDLSSEVPLLLRPGSITIGEIAEVVPEVRAQGRIDHGPTRSPGMMERHYAPIGRVVVFRDVRKAEAVILDAHERGERSGVLVCGSTHVEGDAVVSLPRDAATYARLLYATLHALDDARCDIILVEEPPDDPEWIGVRDRLRRMTR